MRSIKDTIEQVYYQRDYDIKITPRDVTHIDGEAQLSFCGAKLCAGSLPEIIIVQRAIEKALEEFVNNLGTSDEQARMFEEKSGKPMPSHLDAEDHPIAGGPVADPNAINTSVDYTQRVPEINEDISPQWTYQGAWIGGPCGSADEHGSVFPSVSHPTEPYVDELKVAEYLAAQNEIIRMETSPEVRTSGFADARVRLENAWNALTSDEKDVAKEQWSQPMRNEQKKESDAKIARYLQALRDLKAHDARDGQGRHAELERVVMSAWDAMTEAEQLAVIGRR